MTGAATWSDGRASAHIVQVANFITPTSGGIRTALERLRTGYVAAGHRSSLVIPGPEDDVAQTATGVIVQLRAPRMPFSGGYRVLVDVGRVQRTLEGLAPDVIEVSDRFTLRPLGGWAAERGVRSTVVVHERLDRLAAMYMPFPFRIAPAARRDNRSLAERFDSVVVPSQWAAEEFRSAGVTGVKVVGWGVDTEQFHPRCADPVLRRRLARGADVLIAMVCRLSPEKRPDSVIDAVRVLVKSRTSARLIVAGTGSSERSLRRAARGLPVTFLGHVEGRRKIAKLLASSDVAVCPGPVETFGLAAMEALACGTPVVSAASGAIAEKLEPAYGASAHNHGPTLAAAIRRVLALGPQAQVAARAAAERHRWQDAVADMLAIHGIGSRSDQVAGSRSAAAGAPRRS